MCGLNQHKYIWQAQQVIEQMIFEHSLQLRQQLLDTHLDPLTA